MSILITNGTELRNAVNRLVQNTPATDVHTHLYPASFSELMLYGIDELLTYHYLVAETFRHSSLSYDEFWGLEKHHRADHIWSTLFLEHTPISEATRGVLTTINKLGLVSDEPKLSQYRDWYDQIQPQELVDLVFDLAKVKDVVMTNDPFDQDERDKWNSKANVRSSLDNRFHSALRLDPLLNDWETTAKKLNQWGYRVDAQLGETDDESLGEITRFLWEWIQKIDPLYLAASLPSDFKYPNSDIRTILIQKCILPICAKAKLPLSIMVGVKRGVNPSLRLAGDMLASADVTSIENLCRDFPNQKFLVTFLSREDQHHLSVLARKFKNLMIFGCWWFLNTPSLIKETTQMRFELLGTSFVPQHSDARILEQLIYKWSHSRAVIADVLVDQYQGVLDTGWKITHDEVERDVNDLLSDNFWRFIKK
ncbi:hypothetical protein [Acidithrix sp. C25]|uniref:hypothetical protein n=1 Tax=Acidithrix sp. C25 TaxID=1671482 RepID=UPI00191BC24C|nr:hypothetical protein [Acidithrix sp. C25]CAG4910801.1 unnamed protein product [Acidithrix sp. C25]